MKKRDSLHKQLTKSTTNRVIAGVLGGLADYLNIKPNTLRAIYLILTALTSFIPGIVIYIMLVVLIPNNPQSSSPWNDLIHFVHQSHHQEQRGRKELHDVEEQDIHKE